jgi:hypothetical protein
MSRSKEKHYLPSVPSPLNPTTTSPADCPRRDDSNKKPQPRPRSASSRQSPALSYAQHILRAKAAEAWRAEALRRAYADHHHHRGGYGGGGGRDVSDCPLSRAALDMQRGGAVDPARLSPSAPGAEKASFGLLQPFTVDLTQVDPEYRPHFPFGEGGEQRYRGIARKLLLIIALLCLSYCVLPGMRYRATYRPDVLASVTS